MSRDRDDIVHHQGLAQFAISVNVVTIWKVQDVLANKRFKRLDSGLNTVTNAFTVAGNIKTQVTWSKFTRNPYEELGLKSW